MNEALVLLASGIYWLSENPWAAYLTFGPVVAWLILLPLWWER